MGKHVHKLVDKDFVAKTATCAVDGQVKIKVYGNTWRCEVAYHQYQRRLRIERTGTPLDLKTDTCVACGFVAEDLIQMDLDHINGDRTDHRPENMQTLCSNCHRLKSLRPLLFAAMVERRGLLAFSAF